MVERRRVKENVGKFMIPYGRQIIDTSDRRAVDGVLRSDFLTQGPQVKKFEKALSAYSGAKYAVAVCNGTAALHLAYLVAGLKVGDEVLTTPNTFVATANMLIACGAKPIFCDIRTDTYNIDENKIEKLITKKTRAIVPVHFAGQPCDMDKILKIAHQRGLLVIEDAAHALGAKWKNKKIGGLKSDMTIFSFHPVKSITTGEGGAIVTNNKKYYEKLLLLRSHGIVKDNNGFNVMRELGFNYRLTDIQAALGTSQLKKLNSFIKKRRKIALWYKKYLGGCEDIILPKEAAGAKSGWHLYVIRLKDAVKRSFLTDYLKNHGIGINYHYPAVYSHPYYRTHGYKKVNLKNMSLYHKSCLTIPCHATLTEKEVKYISDKIKNFFI